MPSQQDRVLVTGGAGFIGSHLVDHLIAQGDAVTVLDNFASGHRSNLDDARENGDVRIVEGTILDRGDIEKALDGCNRVYHLAVECVRRSLGNPVENHDINATGTINVLEEARRRAIRRFVYCSSSEVYGNGSQSLLNETTSPCEPMTVYGAAKLAGELYTKAYYRSYGMPTTIVRPFNAYGPREHDQGDLAEVIPRFVIRILNGVPPIIFGDGSNGRDFTYVTETAKGLHLSGSSDELIGRTVNIAYGRMATVAELADTLLELCQRPDLSPIYAAARPADVLALRADTSFAREVLGFEAEIGLHTGLTRYLEWFSREHPDVSKLLEERIENWNLPSDSKAEK